LDALQYGGQIEKLQSGFWMQSSSLFCFGI
jgi:hypothetical protein